MSAAFRASLQAEMSLLDTAEAHIDEELQTFFQSLSLSDFNDSVNSSGEKSSSGDAGISAESMGAAAAKIASFSPHFEGMVQNAKKLALQVNDCHALSDRVSVMVRRLDTMQIRAQQALACTEDVLNLKTLRAQLTQLVRDRDLPNAVRCLQQVHKISPEAASTSEDYAHILQQEKEVQGLVQADFAAAISTNKLADVMALCPLLQTLGLEASARDQFLDFVEEHVFIAVTADEAAAGDAKDKATGYANTLSNVFNAAYMILQKYLPMVIQGMENSYGDVIFLQRLHARCEKEAGLVLKRYLSYRDVRSIIAYIQKNKGGDSGSQAPGSAAKAKGVRAEVDEMPTEQQMHIVLDELALLIQYCTLYSKYIKQLCVGSQRRIRPNAVSVGADGKELKKPASAAAVTAGSTNSANDNVSAAFSIFPGPMAFDKMVEELVSRYYMEAERWIMHRSLRSLSLFQLSERGQGFLGGINKGTVLDIPGAAANVGEGLDECFYVLQRCGLRAVATNNIHAACAVLHFISDLLSAELLGKITDASAAASEKVSIALLAHISKFIQAQRRNNRSLTGSAGDGGEPEDDFNPDGTSLNSGFDQLDRTFLSGYRNVVALANTIGAGSGGSSSIQDSEYSAKILTYVNRGTSSSSTNNNTNESAEGDVYGVADCIEVFNIAEKCGRYAARLGDEVVASAETVFATSGQASSSAGKGRQAAPEAEMLVLCKEDYAAAKVGFASSLNAQFQRLADSCKSLIKDLLFQVLGPKGPLGGVRFDLADDLFDQQAALVLLPAALVSPIETMVEITLSELSETNKDVLLVLIVDACCERIEQFILQTGFRFAGALKFEECVRAVMAVLTRASSTPIRSRFSRLREVLMVLTSDVRSSTFADSLSQLTPTEAQTILSLRRDN